METPALSSLLGLIPSAAFVAHDISLGQPPKYPVNFTAFEYVNPNTPEGGIFTTPFLGASDTLNPFTLRGNHEHGTSVLTLNTLTEQNMDEPYAVYGLIAKDIALTPDGLSVTFKVNPKAKFHNSSPVLAEDIATSFDILTEDRAAAPMYHFYWNGVAKVETPNGRTVVFRLKQCNSELYMILGSLPVFSHKSYPEGLAAAPSSLPIGSGPYRFAKAGDGRTSEFARGKNYWAQNLPVRKGRYSYDHIRIKYVKDGVIRVEGLGGGQYDFIQENVARNWACAYPNEVLKKHNLSKHEWLQNNAAGIQGFVINIRHKPLGSTYVRRALIENFDYESVNSCVLYGAYRHTDNFFTNSTMTITDKPDHAETALLKSLGIKLPGGILDQDVPMPPITNPKLGVRPNLLKVRVLLEKGGYQYKNGKAVDKQGKPPTLEFLAPSKDYECIATKWQRDLAKTGITMNVRTTDSAVYQKRISDFDSDVTIDYYGDNESPGNKQHDCFSCAAAKAEGSRNLSGICHPAAERLLTRFSDFTNRQELQTTSRALDRLIRHQYIIVPNWFADRCRVVHRNDVDIPSKLSGYCGPIIFAMAAGWKKE